MRWKVIEYNRNEGVGIDCFGHQNLVHNNL